jgi:hypothetical protein
LFDSCANVSIPSLGLTVGELYITSDPFCRAVAPQNITINVTNSNCFDGQDLDIDKNLSCPIGPRSTNPAYPDIVYAGELNSFIIQARDSFGNLRTQGGNVILVTLTSSNDYYEAIVTDLSNGTYLIEYNITIPALYEVQMTLDGESICGGKSYYVNVLPGNKSSLNVT